MTAFSGDPVVRWVFPDPLQYLSYAPELVRRFCGKAFEGQSAFAVEGFMGAALWLRPGVEPDGENLAELMQRAVPEADREKVSDLFGQMAEYHPHEPLWYLPMIGVDPARQGRVSARLCWRTPSLRSTARPSGRTSRRRATAAVTSTLTTASR